MNIEQWRRRSRAALVVVLAATLVACTLIEPYLPPGTSPRDRGAFDEVKVSHSPLMSVTDDQRKAGKTGLAESAEEGTAPARGGKEERMTVLPRRGDVIDREAARAPTEAKPEGGDFTLNFSDTDIREVVQAILGDILQENFIIDPSIQGTITVQTSRPLKRSEVLPTLETLLRMQGAALVRVDGMYRVVPMGNAVRGNLIPQLPDPLHPRPGYSVRIVPLRYIAAPEMQKILDPFLPEGGVVQVDEGRNMLMLAGTPQELARLQETIDIFDVNWLEGMSVGIFKLYNAEIQDIVNDLDTILGGKAQGPMAGMFRVVPIERLNSLLVITPQPEYLREARTWIERLDRSGEARADARQLHVYQVQNSTADHLAGLLGQLFNGDDGGQRTTPEAQLAPGLEPATIGTGNVAASGDTTQSTGASVDSGGGSGAGTVSGQLEYPLTVVADDVNNALIIQATSRDYEKVLVLLQKLDVIPRQVLVEATIAEVSLGGKLEYGIQWFFDHSIGGSHSGNGGLGNPISATIDKVLSKGFTYAITNSAGQIRLLLDALATESKVRILSSPHLMVLDGQTASMNVGDQVPISTGTTTNDNTTVERFELKDTGVTLEVTPRINAGGMVLMDITQEVTDPGAIDEATGQRTFLQRIIDSSVAMQSGETVVLGGLIRENKSYSESGIPVLHKLPWVGPAFGSTKEELRRTELIVLITPLIVRDQSEALRVTEEIKTKLKGLWVPKPKGKRGKPIEAADL